MELEPLLTLLLVVAAFVIMFSGFSGLKALARGVVRPVLVLSGVVLLVALGAWGFLAVAARFWPFLLAALLLVFAARVLARVR